MMQSQLTCEIGSKHDSKRARNWGMAAGKFRVLRMYAKGGRGVASRTLSDTQFRNAEEAATAIAASAPDDSAIDICARCTLHGPGKRGKRASRWDQGGPPQT